MFHLMSTRGNKASQAEAKGSSLPTKGRYGYLGGMEPSSDMAPAEYRVQVKGIDRRWGNDVASRSNFVSSMDRTQGLPSAVVHG